MAEIIINTVTNRVVFDTEKNDTIVKALRLLLLVGNDEETMEAAYLLDLLSQEKHRI